jgi:hypothetical protein
VSVPRFHFHPCPARLLVPSLSPSLAELGAMRQMSRCNSDLNCRGPGSKPPL